ncbi:MAG: SDR family oxidoreductase [Polyangiaceae bacterium]|nr:SDR family oxidoreductase [Myxococcales bacterium]MCB9590978.1 SDR family oxidoreductase [Polyangiaceae bacterium]
MTRTALVLGGSGYVGSEVVRRLTARDVHTHFTFHASEKQAAELQAATSAQAHRVDLRRPEAIQALFDELGAQGVTPDVLIHCAAVLDTSAPDGISNGDLDEAYAVICRSALLASQLAARGMNDGGDIVLVGALDRAQSLPIPTAFAACQGMLSGLSMGLAKELGARNVRVNLLTFGLLEGGLSRRLPETTRNAYLNYSAARRFGTAAEAARSIAWLALDNRYMSGKVAAFNGGI